MKERPILFSGEMVRAILEGRKSQTRRVVQPQPHAFWDKPNSHPELGLNAVILDADKKPHDKWIVCPYGQPGDRLWVRETFIPDPPIDGWPGDVEWNGCGRKISGVPKHYQSPDRCIFRASWTGGDLRWNPAIFMPRWASRILLEITNVRVERVQEISKNDVLAEGIKRYLGDADGGFPAGWQDIRPGYGGSVWTPSAFKDAYRVLWDSINEKRGFGFNENPWVWVIEFATSSREEFVRDAAESAP